MFKEKSNHCDKVSHREEDCWNKEENSHCHPKNWKPRGENRQAAIDQNRSVETLLMAIDSECCVHRKYKEVETETWYETEGAIIYGINSVLVNKRVMMMMMHLMES
eukprot:6398828-Ditylum_brightwellii.AAC.1